MQSILFVGFGGFIGSVLRYGLGRITLVAVFPLMTMLINFFGSFIIGFVSELAKNRTMMSTNAVLFLQTGICGGFTTFSTFSLETVNLFRNNKYVMGASYVAASVGLCLLGVVLGVLLARVIKAKLAQ
jgi:CrcB protein